jgi:hypothetical protein
MQLVSQYYMNGASRHCANCQEPFPQSDNHVKAWHGQDGKYYCTEDCEQDALEAHARRAKMLS